MSEAMAEDPDLGSDPDLVQDLSQFCTGTSVVNGSKRKISTAKAAGRPKGPWLKHYCEEKNGGDRKDAICKFCNFKCVSKRENMVSHQLCDCIKVPKECKAEISGFAQDMKLWSVKRQATIIGHLSSPVNKTQQQELDRLLLRLIVTAALPFARSLSEYSLSEHSLSEYLA
jgi:hypothetical protein